MLRLWKNPLCRLEANILADPQFAACCFQQVAHNQRISLFAQCPPGVVFVQRFHLAALLVIFWFDRSATAHMRSPSELLLSGFLHAVDPIYRHRPYIVIELRARYPSCSPCSIHRLIRSADQHTASLNEPKRVEGSISTTGKSPRGCRTRKIVRKARNGNVVSTLSAMARDAPMASATHTGRAPMRPPSTYC